MALRQALSVLNGRERRVFEARRLADDSIRFEDLATEFGVSCERVRQIEVRAFEKVQIELKSRVAAMELPPVRDRTHFNGQPPALTGLRVARLSVAFLPA